MQHARRLPHAAGVQRQVDALVRDRGGVTGVRVIPQEGAPLAGVFLAAVAVLPLACLAMADASRPLTVGARQDVHEHDVTRWDCRVLGLSYTRREEQTNTSETSSPVP